MKQKEPEINCFDPEKQIKKPSQGSSDLLTGVLIVLTVVLIALGIFGVPSTYRQIVIIVASAAVIASLFLYLLKAENKRTAIMRNKVKSFFFRLLFIRLLQLDHARSEFTIWFYDKRLERFSSSSFRKLFLEFDKSKIEIKISPSLRPKFPLEINRTEIEWLNNTPTNYWNSVIYRLESIDKSELGLSLSFGPGCYFDYLATCNSIGREIDAALRSQPIKLLKRRLKASDSELESFYRDVCRNLPLRKKYASSRDTIEMPATKCLKMGISNVILLYDDQKKLYRFLLGYSSEKVLEYPGTYNVVPGGTFSPCKKQYFYDELEGSPFCNVLRELYEECFIGSKNEERDKTPIPMRELIKFEKIDFIYSRKDDPSLVEFKIMGIYFDLIYPKVEMTTCLVVHDSDYLKQLETNGGLVYNWEYGSELLKIPFSKVEVYKWIGSQKMVPIGSLALRDAIQSFPNLLQ